MPGSLYARMTIIMNAKGPPKREVPERYERFQAYFQPKVIRP